MEVNQETIAHLAELSNFALDEDQSTRLVSNIKEIVKLYLAA